MTPPTAHKPARRTDLTYIVDLANRHRHELGFLPRAAFTEYVDRHRALLALENQCPAGYVLWRPPNPYRPPADPPTTRIIHACIQFDARRHQLATDIIAHIERQTPSASPGYITCWCAEDLDANAFWSAIGFRLIGQRERRIAGRTTRRHNLWIRDRDR